MRPALLAIAAILAAALVACNGAGEAPPPEIHAPAVMEHARALVDLGPREAGGEAAARGAEVVARALEGLGLEVERIPTGVIDVPPIDTPVLKVPAGRVELADPSLVVRLPGAAPGPAMVFMAHYDSVPESPGAMDNAVSVGILIELARALRERPPARPVIIAITAGEEIRLLGARRLAAVLAERGEAVGLAVSLDLVGAAPSVMNGLSSLLGREWLRWLEQAGRQAGVRVGAPWPHRVFSRLLPALERSDHKAFTERGVPALHLYGRGPGDGRIYLPYHTRDDTADRVVDEEVEATGRFVTALARKGGALPATGGDPGMWVPMPDGGAIVVPRVVAIGVEGLLGILAVVAVVVVWRRGNGELGNGDLNRRQATGDRRPTTSGRSSRQMRTDDLPGRQATGDGAVGLVWLIAGLLVVWAVVIGEEVVIGKIVGHGAVWVHRPLVAVAVGMGSALVVGAMVWMSPVGRRALATRGRFAVAAVAPWWILGVLLMVASAHELAWMPLASAALIGAAMVAPGRAAPVVVFAVSVVPMCGLVAPGFLREAIFHRFIPPSLPLAAILAVLSLAHAIALVPIAARALGGVRARLPRWAFAIPAAVFAALVATSLLTARAAPCDGRSFDRAGLACEIDGARP